MLRFIPLFFNTAFRSCSHSCHASLISPGEEGEGVDYGGGEERGGERMDDEGCEGG